MTGLWSVIVPSVADVTNMVINPSGETADTGYAGITATVAASTAYSRRGYRSISAIPSTAVNDGLFYDSVTLVSGTTYTAAFDIDGLDTIPYKAYFADTAGNAQTAAATSITGNGAWQRISHTYASTASANFRLYITKNNNESTGTYYVDGVGVYALAYDPGHVDGDQPDCVWNGTAHASTSYRKANSVEGGQTTNFDSYGFYLSEYLETGMVGIDPFSQPYTLLPGSMDEGERITERTFSLVGDLIGNSLADLHSKRKALTSLFRPGRVLWLVYSGGNSARPTRIKAKYIRGLGFGEVNGFTERMALQFQATDPFWYEDGQEGAALLSTASDSDAAYAVKLVDNVWGAVHSGFNQSVRAIAKLYDGSIVYGGQFTGVSGSSNSDYIVRFSDKSSTSPLPMGTGMDGAVYALELDAQGYLYAAGGFSLAGGVAGTVCLAYWDGTAWNPVGGGPGAVCYDMVIDYSGNIYVCGAFQNLTDVNGDYITKWNGSSYVSLGTGLNNDAYALAVGKDNSIYVGGTFTAAGGVSNTNYIARWDGTQWVSIGNMGGSSPYVFALAVAPNGDVYAGGQFTTAGGVACNYIAKWNGKTWEPLGSGLNGAVYFNGIKIAPNGDVYVSGSFTTAGGLAVDRVAIWRGSTWTTFPVDFPGSPTVCDILFDGDDMYIGYSTSGTAVFTNINLFVSNSGTARAYPRMEIKRTDTSSTDTVTVEWLENRTTSNIVMINNYPLLCGETLAIDFRLTSRRCVSSYFGNVIGRAIQRGADFAAFRLEPGYNKLGVKVAKTGSAAVTTSMFWPVAHLSLDGSAT